MGSRLAAAVVLLAGIAVLAWVALRSETAPVTTGFDFVETAPADATVIETAGIASTADSSNDKPAATAESSTDEAAASLSAEPASPEPAIDVPASPEPAIDVPENFGPRRSLVDLDGWLNTDITSLDELDGQVVMVEMWTFGCSNCKARIPYNQAYYEEFADQGFEIVGVHAPEFSYEADIANIEKALVDLGVTWPVALDTNKKNFRSWQSGSTSYWPRTYVIDQNGDIRYDHIGEGRYEELRQTIAYLLDNPAPAPTS